MNKTANPATATDVLAVFRGEVTGPGADMILASYFAPGPEPRYDTIHLGSNCPCCGCGMRHHNGLGHCRRCGTRCGDVR